MLVVADENTYAVAGARVENALSEKAVDRMIFGKELLVPNEAAIGKIAGDQLIKLMTLGLTEAEAEQQIINGFLS